MQQSGFFGKKVVAATFVMAMLGWGIGFYGPPIFLYAVLQRTGWSISLGSAAVTLHFLAGTLVIVNLPRLYKRFGLPRVTLLGAAVLAMGVLGWAVASQPWQLFIAAVFSGLGWVCMGAAAVNAVIAPWYASKRPVALAMAYNGASIGGVVFSSAWVYLINTIGFTQAALLVGAASVLIIAWLAHHVFAIRPEQLGQFADGADQPPPMISAATGMPTTLWRNRQFVTLAAGMSLGLFAQIGLITHLFILLVEHLSQQQAALAMGLATASAIVGRTLVGWLMPPNANRRHIACLSYAVQLTGCLLMLAAATSPGLIWPGVILIGAGIGNATSLPPLIAQAEFAREHVTRVVALIVATAQGCYALAPAVFGLVKSYSGVAQGGVWIFALAAAIQGFAIAALLTGKVSAERQLPERSAAN